MKEIKTIQILPSNRYFAIITGGATNPKQIYRSYAIIDAVAIVVYEDLEICVGGLDLGCESMCCGNNILGSTYGNLKDRLFANDLEDFISNHIDSFDISRKEAISLINKDFKRTNITIMADAELIFKE